MNSKARFRIRLIFGGVIVAALAITFALYRIQILKGSTYAAKAQAQYAKPSVSVFDRGSIFFQAKDGTRVAAAALSRGYLVYLNQKLLINASQAYDALSQYLSSLDKTSFMKAAKSSGSYVELEDKVDPTTAGNIQNLNISGIGVAEEAWRSYPGGTLAAHALGIIGETASSTVSGRYGLEYSYNSVLSRSSQGGDADTFAGLFGGLGSIFGSDSDTQGDVITTIEPSVQSYLEKVLTDTQAVWHPSEIGGIIMDPQTGEIAALSSLPSFNPNDLSHLPSVAVLANPLVEHVYEMGSIMKPLTMAMALDTGVEKLDSTYNDVGCEVIDGKKICNYDGRARGVIPMQQILSQSLNIGAATIALAVNSAYPGDMLKYFSSYGLGTTTGIDLPNEATGLIGNLKKPKDIDIATAAYGQGIAVSPIEMIRGLSVLANGGYLVTPHVADEIDYVDGSKKMIRPVKQGPVLQPGTVQEVDTMLTTVVDKAFATGTLSMQHYSIAAKTGTAEIADPVNGGYYPDRYLHSFFGFFPAYNPRFIIFLYQIYPKGALYASATLTKPFADLSKFLIDYYNIPPDR
jgi:cell division protein FtsI (penicillin-binding protein 3)/stage V sporulation protein D (sporulation-specific penicillin-binding protein)